MSGPFQIRIERAAQAFLIIILVVTLGGFQNFDAGSASDEEGGHWGWDLEREERVFVPASLALRARRSPSAAAYLTSSSDASTPLIGADPVYDWINGWDWPAGNTVYLCVDSGGFTADPTYPSNCDLYHGSMVADGSGDVFFDVGSLLDLAAYHYISMGDTWTNKFHQVTNLTVTGADAATDEVTGTAPPGTQVEVYEYDTFNSLLVAANGSGDWVADFTVTTDLVAGSSGDASQYDADGDYTSVYWMVPNPIISAQPDRDRIHGYDWPEGATIHLCIDGSGFAGDPTNPANCGYYYGSTVVPAPNPGQMTFISFDLSLDHDLQGGDYVVMSDGTTTKQHQVTPLVVMGVDPLTDIVSGTAAAASDVHVGMFGCGGCFLDVVANGSGAWSADFSSIAQDIQAGDGGYAVQYDLDWDETWVNWNVPDPWVSAAVDTDIVYALDWPVGSTIHLCIDSTGFAADPSNPSQCSLYYGSAIVPAPPPGYISQLNFLLSGDHDVQAGDYIAMTDGTTTKHHQVMNLMITDVSVSADTVSGSADPSSDVRVWIFDCSGTCNVSTSANGSGDWVADFSGIGVDILLGDSGYASQFDPDGDETWLQWSVPMYELYLPLVVR